MTAEPFQVTQSVERTQPLLSANSATGVVKLTADPDYETQSSYSFTVTATDAAGTSNANSHILDNQCR